MTGEAIFICGDAEEEIRNLPAGFADACITSPPYWGLRRYSDDEREVGREGHLEAYLDRLAVILEGVRLALKPQGTLWLNLGDLFAGGTEGARHAPEPGGGPRVKTGKERSVKRGEAGLPRGCLIGLPWRVALRLVDAGWILRRDIVWEKPNPMPEPPTANRPTSAHEFLFQFAKAPGYYWDKSAMEEPTADGGGTRNRRDVWRIPTYRFPEAHYATFPPDLIRGPLRATCPPDGIVLDPFAGAGTTACVALEEGRNSINIEIATANIEIAERRVAQARAGRWR